MGTIAAPTSQVFRSDALKLPRGVMYLVQLTIEHRDLKEDGKECCGVTPCLDDLGPG